VPEFERPAPGELARRNTWHNAFPLCRFARACTGATSHTKFSTVWSAEGAFLNSFQNATANFSTSVPMALNNFSMLAIISENTLMYLTVFLWFEGCFPFPLRPRLRAALR